MLNVAIIDGTLPRGLDKHHNSGYVVMQIPKLLSTRETAKQLGIPKSTLDQMRLTGDGPVFIKRGKSVFYTEEDLIDWIDSNRRRSTSDLGSVTAAP